MAEAARGSSSWRAKHWASCGDADMTTREFGPQRIRLHVARAANEAVEALFDVFAAHGYVVRQKVTGAYNCRKITGGRTLSSHAYAIAIDVNWDTNPYVKGKLVTDMPAKMIEAVHRITTVAGLQVWRWGGDWDNRPNTPHAYYDAMHFEIVVTPAELRAGIDRIVRVDAAAARPKLAKDSRGPAVVQLQALLTTAGFPVPNTGAFLAITDRQVRAYQLSRGLTADGIVGPATWTALLFELPPVGKITPSKGVA
jgi:hypothetical protein